MSSICNQTGRVLPAIVALLAATASPSAQAAESDEYQKFLNKKSPAVVRVKFVLKVKMGGMMAGMGDQESENEINGVMIDPKGLVLCSNSQLGGFVSMISRMMGPAGAGISATPTDFKILLGDDVEGREAELLARDTELDLAWVKIKEPGDKPFEHVDFSKGAKPEIGERVVAVRRMGKYFARSAVVIEGHIGGVTAKPRDLYVPSGEIAMAFGLPIYLRDGKVIGVTILQMPEEEDVEPDPMAMFGRLSNMQEMMSGVILPAADVAKATRRARASADTESTAP